MSRPTEFTELYDLIGGLRRSLAALKTRYADVPGMRRIVADIDRLVADAELLDADLDELDLSRWAATHPEEKITIPDTEYDIEFWRDVDDEGLGGSRF